MYLRNYHSAVASIFLCLFFFACHSEKDSPATQQASASESPVFVLRTANQTGVDFVNTLEEGLNTNVLMYEYFYNGGGVAAGDFNGDERIDLYFSSNMGEHKFYLNKGNFRFEEVSAKAGLEARPGPWKTGVSLVDINGDQRLDLYLCYSGALPPAKRRNELFINMGNDENGIPRFEEKASEYGLASEAFSNQGYFFDYDKDGDLDMLLLNHNPKSLPVLNEQQTVKAIQINDPNIGIRLYRQDGKRFTDVTLEAGISSSPLTYGLGIGIADLNNDGWPDFYVSNDYTIPDYLYINQQNGRFENRLEESLRYNSQFSMGNDIADFNNDGWPDIFTLDMLPEDNKRQKLLMAPDNYSKFDLNVRSGFYHQYMRNMLQLNNGNETFSEVGQLAGISNTDWSWAALAADYNNDGWKDLYITNGYHRDYTNLDFIKYMDDFVKSRGQLKRQDVLEIINNMPSSDVINYMFSSNKGQTFSNTTQSWGLQHISNSNGAAYADLDNDGDLDLIVNNINKEAFLYENLSEKSDQHSLQIRLEGDGLNTQGLGAKICIYTNAGLQCIEQYPARGYLSSVSPLLHFGLGKTMKIDSLIIDWPSGKREKRSNIQVDQILTLSEKDAGKESSVKTKQASIFQPIASAISHENPPQNIRDFDRQSLLISELSHRGPCMRKGDLNGDGLEDVFIGGAAGQSAAIYLQQIDQSFKKTTVPDFEKDKASEDSNAILFDADGDGDTDIYIAKGGYHHFEKGDPLLQDRLYLNDGQGVFLYAPNALPHMPGTTKALAVQDVNDDGFMDLFVGGSYLPGSYPLYNPSYLLINDGKGRFSDQISSLSIGLKDFGAITDAEWIDLNNDQRKELIVIGDWLPISAFVWKGNQLINQSKDYFDKVYKGWWNELVVADVNNDQRPDLLVGNNGINIQFKVSEQEPAELYFNDFDKNGSVDPLFCYYIQGESYPFITRDELLGQLAPLRSKFTTYESYANAKIEDIFSQNDLKDAGRWAINHLETSLFIATEGGYFEYRELPLEAQYAPVNAIGVADYTGDGQQDVLLCGNNSHTKLRIGRLDANYGILLQGDGKGGFEYIDQMQSGLQIKGDVHSLIQIDNRLFFGINQQAVVSYQLQEK